MEALKSQLKNLKRENFDSLIKSIFNNIEIFEAMNLLESISLEYMQTQNARIFNNTTLKQSKAGHRNLNFVFLQTTSHKKEDLIKATRQINKIRTDYFIIFFVSMENNKALYLSISFALRRINNTNENRDVIEEINIIKDIDCQNTHKGHLQNLVDIQNIVIHDKAIDTYYDEILEALSIQNLQDKFYKEIADIFVKFVEQITLPLAQNDDSLKKAFTLRLLGRILFCKFLEKKGIIKKELFDTNLSSHYYHKVLGRLFFDTLNTPKEKRDFGTIEPRLYKLLNTIPYLNGGLFAPIKDDFYNDFNLEIPNELFSELFSIFDKYHFSIDENNPRYEIVGLDPEMLGAIFETLLSLLFTDNADETKEIQNLRKTTGSFYTSRIIVEYMTTHAIMSCLQAKGIDKNSAQNLIDAALGSSELALTDDERKKILEILFDLRVFDPACGSGAFPMGILNVLCDIFELLDSDARATKLCLGGGLHSSHSNRYIFKLYILQNIIYGVDIQSMASEISRLRAFLSLIIDEDLHIEPLPNLEFKFMSANSLLELPKDNTLNYADYGKDLEKLMEIRAKTFGTSNKDEIREEYLTLRDHINKETYGTLGDDKNPFADYDPFDPLSVAGFFDSSFMFGIDGFDIVIGNPPYIRQEEIKELKPQLQKRFSIFKGTSDIYTYFFELGMGLLKDNGILNLITSNKFTRAGYGEPLRKFLLSYELIEFVDLNGKKVFKHATVDTIITSLKKSQAPQNHKFIYKNCDVDIRDLSRFNLATLAPANLAQDTLNSEAFIFSDEASANLKAKIESIGTPLKDWDISINYGIKTGYNEAFIIDTQKRDEILAKCDDSESSLAPFPKALITMQAQFATMKEASQDAQTLEDLDSDFVMLNEKERTSELIKPILRGRDIKKYSYQWAGLWIIATFPALKLDIENYPSLKSHLESFMPRIAQSGEKGCRKKTSNKWFETQDNIAYYGDFARQKVVWNPVSGEYFFTYIKEEMYFNNSLFMMTSKFRDEFLFYVLGLMNSTLYKWLMTQVTNLMETGKYAYGAKDKIEKLPIPRIDSKQEGEFIKIVNEILEIKKTIDSNNKEASSGVWEVKGGIRGATSQFKPPCPSLKDLDSKLKDLEERLDSMVFTLYNLNETERELVLSLSLLISLLTLVAIASRAKTLLEILLGNFENELKESFRFCEGLKVPKVEFEGKIIYPNMAKEFIAYLDKEGFFTNQKCFILTQNNLSEDRLLYLTAILNSKVNFWYFKQIGATLGASGYEMSKIFVERLPVPKITDSAILHEIESLAMEILDSKNNLSAETKELENRLDTTIYKLYHLAPHEIALVESSFASKEREREQN